MKAMLFIREVGQTKFVQENGMFEDSDDGTPGQQLAFAKGEQMCREGSVESFQVWTLAGEYNRVTRVEVQSA